MAHLQSRRLITAIILPGILLPLVSFAQVTIKEKVEIQPKAPAKVALKSERQGPRAAGSGSFFDPPFFGTDPYWGTGLALRSTFTISGSIAFGGPIGVYQHAVLLEVGAWEAEHHLAWKGRGGWPDGIWYEGSTSYTATYDGGWYPDVRLYLYDIGWRDGVRTITFSETDVTYNFTGFLSTGGFPYVPVPVTATATASGSVVPEARFDSWQLMAENMTVTGHDSTLVEMVPLDGTGSGYSPYGFSPADAEVTLRVDAPGDYVYLAYAKLVPGRHGQEDAVIQYRAGREITIPPLPAGFVEWVDENGDGEYEYYTFFKTFLVYDDSKGTFEGHSDTVHLTITGGGRSKTIPVVLEKSEILLGETKYFYVTAGDPKIKETKETTRPSDLNWTFEWGDEPVTPVQEETNSGKPSGKKLGVYWETGKPIPNSTDPLPTGLIRLVGRYWHADSTYKVQLKASNTTGSSVSLVVEVKKPAKLLKPLQNPSYSTVRNVFADPNSNAPNLDLDALIIKYAGENGIPPQFIKGQMLHETTFRPAWRYEPFSDVTYQHKEEIAKEYFGKDMPFVVNETSMGTGNWPSEHRNVYPTSYVSAPIKISKFTTDHWGRYVRHETGNTPDRIVENEALSSRWNVLYLEAKKNKKLTDAKAREQAHTKLKNELLDVDADLGKRFDLMAQTRKVTSYGFIQMIYITAASPPDNKYSIETDGRYKATGTSYVDQNDKQMFPEKLNEEDFLMPIYCDRLLRKMKNLKFKSAARIPPSNWPDGFEDTWRATLQSYNSGETDYGKNVLIKAQGFEPSR
jgi:hypothetical protein